MIPLHQVRRIPGEIFKEFEDGYYLSNHGRFYSSKSNKILKQELNTAGYLRFRIIRKWYLTHIKVIELFGDRFGCNLPDNSKSLIAHGLSIDHVSGDKSDNSVYNLEIVTHRENCRRREEMKRNNKHATMSMWDMLD